VTMESMPTRRIHVHIDAEKCQGHSRCYALAPDIFDVDELGQATVVGSGFVTTELEDRAHLAAANCPEVAIRVDVVLS
jgi:ferredoxin